MFVMGRVFVPCSTALHSSSKLHFTSCNLTPSPCLPPGTAKIYTRKPQTLQSVVEKAMKKKQRATAMASRWKERKQASERGVGIAVDSLAADATERRRAERKTTTLHGVHSACCRCH